MEVTAKTVFHPRSPCCDLKGFGDTHEECGTFVPLVTSHTDIIAYFWHKPLKNKSHYNGRSFTP